MAADIFLTLFYIGGASASGLGFWKSLVWPWYLGEHVGRKCK